MACVFFLPGFSVYHFHRGLGHSKASVFLGFDKTKQNAVRLNKSTAWRRCPGILTSIEDAASQSIDHRKEYR